MDCAVAVCCSRPRPLLSPESPGFPPSFPPIPAYIPPHGVRKCTTDWLADPRSSLPHTHPAKHRNLALIPVRCSDDGSARVKSSYKRAWRRPEFLQGNGCGTPIELEGFPPRPSPPSEHHAWGKGTRLGDNADNKGSNTPAERDHDLPPPATAPAEALQRWNQPGVNRWRVAAAFWGFIVCGSNDAAYGPLIPHLERYYDLNFVVVSLVFLSPFVGYTLSALINNRVHVWGGQRAVAAIGPAAHLAAYAVVCAHPPYPALVVAFALAGFGNGLQDAAWNAWIGNMDRANEVLGFLHAFYGLGAVVAPPVVTAMAVTAGLPWWTFYYVMIAMAAVELATSVAAFWRADAKAYRDSLARGDSDGTRGALREALFKPGYARVTWLVAAFLLAYVGAEVSIGGWIVKFMIDQRQAGAFESGMSAMGFWLGLVVGRVVLGFVTPRLGEKRAVACYIVPTMALQLVFWLVPQFYVSAVAVSLQGFFIGPLFPAAIVVATKLLPKHLHVSAIGFAAAVGGSGAAVVPFAVGAIAQAKGVAVLQPIILAIFVVLFAVWLSLPRIGKKRE
ncbi:hypothetical protein RB598_002088 [Gaeumannomyces tritici]